MFMFGGNPRFQQAIPGLFGAFMGSTPHINVRVMRQPNKRKEAAKILDVDEDAKVEVIQKAYKLALKKWHPDRYSDKEKPMARKKFDEVVKAKEILLKKVETDEMPSQDSVFQDFANKVFEDFMRPAPTTEDEELDAEAEDLFDFLHGMAEPPPQAEVFSFGPDGLRPKRESLTFRVRIDLKDVWANQVKKLPVKDRYLLLMPLNHSVISYVGSEEEANSPFDEITVNLIDKPNLNFRRRGTGWDLETFYPIALKDLYKDQVLTIKMLDEKELKVRWKGEDAKMLEDQPEKGFFLYDQGLPKPDGTRGKLWVRFAIQLKGEGVDVDTTDKGCISAEIGTQEDWWNLSMEDRSIILDLDAHLSTKPGN